MKGLCAENEDEERGVLQRRSVGPGQSSSLPELMQVFRAEQRCSQTPVHWSRPSS